MKILIIGGGFLGQRLAITLAKRGTLRGQQIIGLALTDIVKPNIINAGFPVSSAVYDTRNPDDIARTITAKVDVIFLLAAVVYAKGLSTGVGFACRQ